MPKPTKRPPTLGRIVDLYRRLQEQEAKAVAIAEATVKLRYQTRRSRLMERLPSEQRSEAYAVLEVLRAAAEEARDGD